MKETEWADSIAKKLDAEFRGVNVVSGQKLMYANEIIEYTEEFPEYNEMSYETDILVYEGNLERSWKPRVVIEAKIDSVTTHDAITYSQKSATHKYVHPYLRYGIFIGNRKDLPLPGRLFRHGAHFDFMLSCSKYTPEVHEWIEFKKIVKSEIEASKKLEEMIFNSRSRIRKKYFVVHKPLVTKSINGL